MMKFNSVLLISLIFITLFWPVMFGFGLVAGLVALASTTQKEEVSSYTYHWGDESSSNQILSIPVYGPILDERPELSSFDPFLSVFATYGTQIKELLYEAANDDQVKAVILEINSPGGTVTGSKAIADGLAYYKQTTQKPIYVHASGLMASGGYWVAASADEILVETGSLVGSIGVIGGEFATYNNVVEINQGLLGQGITTTDGIEVTMITAGEGKDLGNPFRQPTEKELSLVQESANQAYLVFANYVADQRQIPQEEVINTIGAYVYGEQQALNLGLIDQIANRETAYQQLAETIELGNDFQIVRYEEDEGFFTSLLRAASRGTSSIKAQEVRQQKTCYYTHQVMAYYGHVVDLCP